MMIQANRDPNVFIKEIDKHCIHVRLTKVDVNPADPVRFRSENSIIQVFSAVDFEKMQKRHSNPDEWVKIGGFTSAYVVHDGRLVPQEETVKDEVAEALDQVVSQEVKEAVKREARKRNYRNSLKAK